MPKPTEPRLSRIDYIPSMDVFEERRHSLAKVLRQHDLTGFIASSSITMEYLSGFSEDGGERFMALVVDQQARAKLFCPALSISQAKRSGVLNVQGFRDGESPEGAFRDYLKSAGINERVAIDDDMRGAQVLQLQSWLPHVVFQPGAAVLAEVTRTKGDSELEHLFQAGGIADSTFADIRAWIKPGQSEREVARKLAELMESRGGLPSFTIVASGPAGAEPHHHADDRQLREGDVVVLDFGCSVAGYHSDITRTVALGAPDPEAVAVYRTVFEAHMAAREAIRPGVTNGAIDSAARRVIEDAGYGEYFVHRTGHGLGMRVHEEPNIVPGGTDPVREGDCFSIEPGIYLPGRFGIRIENIVTVTSDGHRSFNAEPPADLPELNN